MYSSNNIINAIILGKNIKDNKLSKKTGILWNEFLKKLENFIEDVNHEINELIDIDSLHKLINFQELLNDHDIHSAADKYIESLRHDVPLLYSQYAQKIINIQHNHGNIYIQAISEKHNISSLRRPIADFIGQDEYINMTRHTLCTSVNEVPIINIHGMAGIGKTEFVYKVASETSNHFTDGQISLNTYGSSDIPLTASGIIQRILVLFDENMSDLDDFDALQHAYHSTLASKRILILLDDVCEAAQVIPLIPPAGCALLVTSRVRFTVPGMVNIELPLMQPNDAHTMLSHLVPRVESFVPTLTRLCGYHPLAIRVLAGVINKTTRPIGELISLLTEERTRLNQLRDNATNLDIVASLNMSYQLLDSPTQRIFNQLGIFITSFSFVSVNAVIERRKNLNLYQMLDHLYERHLIQYDHESQRYSLHDLVRIYALQHLKRPNALRQRYSKHYLQIVQHLEPFLTTTEQQMALDLLDIEHDHIRASLVWAESRNEANITCEFTSRLWRFWESRGYFIEGLEWLTKSTAMSIEQCDPKVLANVYAGIGSLEKSRGHLEPAHRAFGKSLDIWVAIQDTRGIARMNNNLGQIALFRNQFLIAKQYFTDSLTGFETLDDKWGCGIVLCHLGMVAHEQEQYTVAEQYYQDGLQHLRMCGDKVSQARYLDNYAHTLRLQNNLPKASQIVEESLQLREEINDPWGIASAHETLGLISLAEGRLDDSANHFRQSLTLTRALGDDEGIIWALEGLGAVAVLKQEFSIATRILMATAWQRILLSIELQPSEIPRYKAMYAAISLPWPPIESSIQPSGIDQTMTDQFLDAIIAEFDS